MTGVRGSLSALLARVGLGPVPAAHSTEAPVRFVMIGTARSGSTMLSSLINSHSRAIAYGELFRDEDAIGWDLPQLDAKDPERLPLFRRDPVRFLKTMVYRQRDGGTEAIGFKLFYYHARNKPFASVWDWLRRDRTIRVIHIRRLNALAQYLSLERAKRTGCWVEVRKKGVKGVLAQGDAQRRAPDPLLLDPDDCARHIEWLREQEQRIDALFAAHPLLQVSYEDLAADLPREAARIQAFLGLPEETLSVRTSRQSSAPLHEAIANFAELRERLAGTPYARFLEPAQSDAAGEARWR